MDTAEGADWSERDAAGSTPLHRHALPPCFFGGLSADQLHVGPEAEQTSDTPWRPTMTSYNSCPNLSQATDAFGGSSLEESRSATPLFFSSLLHSGLSHASVGNTSSTAPSQPEVHSSLPLLARSQSRCALLEQLSPPNMSRKASPDVPILQESLFSAQRKPASASSSDAMIALRQTALSRSASEHSATSSLSTPLDSQVSSQTSISPASAIKRSESSASLASSFSSCFGADEYSLPKTSPSNSEGIASPAVVSLVRQGGRATRSKSNTSLSLNFGKPRRSSKLTELDRKRICEYHRDHPSANQDTIGLRFGVERSTVSKTLKDRDRWLAIEEDPEATVSSRSASNRRTGTGSAAGSRAPSPGAPPPLALKTPPTSGRSCRFPEVETQVVEWARSAARSGDALTDQALKERARTVASSMGIGEHQFKASQGWLERFKVRAGIAAGRFLENEMLSASSRTDSDKAFSDAAFPLPSPADTISSSSSASSFMDGEDQDMTMSARSCQQQQQLDEPAAPQYAHARSHSALSQPMALQLPLDHASTAHTKPHSSQPSSQQLQVQNDLSGPMPLSVQPVAGHHWLPSGITAASTPVYDRPEQRRHFYVSTSSDPSSVLQGPYYPAPSQSQGFQPGPLRRATVSFPEAGNVQQWHGPYHHYQQHHHLQNMLPSTAPPGSVSISAHQASGAISLLSVFLQQQPALATPSLASGLYDLQLQLSTPPPPAPSQHQRMQSMPSAIPPGMQQSRSFPAQRVMVHHPVPKRPIQEMPIFEGQASPASSSFFNGSYPSYQQGQVSFDSQPLSASTDLGHLSFA